MLTIPFGAVKCLKRTKEKRILCEISEDVLRQYNEPQTLDELLAEASLEHVLGNLKTFDTVDDLIADLRS